MEFTSLGSGSKGNVTVVRAGSTTLLIDCGLSWSEIQNRLEARNLSYSQINAILITHEHGDHHRGVEVVARREQIPIYASSGTLHELYRRNPNVKKLGSLITEISPGVPFRINDIAVHPISVPHDVEEPAQYVCRYQDLGVGVLTDCGSLTEEMVEHFGGLDGLLLETNHDLDMLWNGPYPEQLKARVGGDYGHLSNRQSREFAERIHHVGLQHLVLGHISEQNNALERIMNEFDDLPSGTAITIATQDGGTEWLRVTSN